VPDPVPPPAAEEAGFLERALANTAVRGALRSAASAATREIVRSLFGTARRRRR
jgi:hypothetical protein